MRKVGSVVLVLWIASIGINKVGAVEDSLSSRATLKGLPGVIVGVPRLSGCESAGAYGPAIRVEVESQLRQVEIGVLKTGHGTPYHSFVLSRLVDKCHRLSKHSACGSGYPVAKPFHSECCRYMALRNRSWNRS